MGTKAQAETETELTHEDPEALIAVERALSREE
jgi:hypothetical protein